MTFLRPYQSTALLASLQTFRHSKSQIISLPVGSGKTVLLAHLIQSYPQPHKTLVLAHRIELLQQAASTIKRINPTLQVVLESSKAKERDAEVDADVVVASVATLGKLRKEVHDTRVDEVDEDGEFPLTSPAEAEESDDTTYTTTTTRLSPRLTKFPPTHFDLIIIDEAHHSTALSYMRVLRHFNALPPNAKTKLWGCSATVLRHDGVKLGAVFQQLSFHLPLIEMVQQRHLAPLVVSTIKTNVKVDAQDDQWMCDQIRNQQIVKAWLKTKEAGNATATLGFCVDIKHLHSLVKAFHENGIDARSVTGTTPAMERADLMTAFRKKEFPVLLNCGVVTEGTDIPVIDCLLMSRPTRSGVLFQQMIGRGLRLYPGKEKCTVLDFVDAFEQRDRLITFPSLLGLHPDEVLSEYEARFTEPPVQEDEAPIRQDDFDPSVFLDPDISDPFDPFNHLSEAQRSLDQCPNAFRFRLLLRTLSPLAFVWISDEHFVLPLVRSMEGNQMPSAVTKVLELKLVDGQWAAKWFTRTRGSMFGSGGIRKKYEVAINHHSDTIEHLISGIHTLIPPYADLHSTYHTRTAPWRTQPATPRQINFLRICGFRKESDHVTKGEATDWIAWTQYGGRKRYQADLKKHKTAYKNWYERAETLEAQRIRVGPLEA